MIHIKVRDYRGIAQADIEVSRIALITGLNGSGKTSILQAVGAALCGRTLPVDGVRRADANSLVRAGSDSGYVSVLLDESRSVISWPACEARSEGPRPPKASAVAAGLEDVLAMKDRERVDMLAKVMRSQPNHDDLVQAFRDTDLDAAVIKLVWEKIEVDGWDATFERAKKKGQEMKGSWQQITKEAYGSVKAGQWVPAGFTPGELEDCEEDALKKAVASAQATLESAISAAAVDAAAIADLRSQASDEPALVEQRAEALDNATKADAELDAARTARSALPPAAGDDSMPCPHCSKPVVMRQVRLGESRLEKAPDKVTAAELKKRREAIAAADGTVGRLQDASSKARSALADLDAKLNAARGARAKLATMGDAAGSAGGDDQPDVSDARVALSTAQARLDAWNAYMDAQHWHDQIRQNALIQDVLKPEGLRKTKAANAIEAFNTTLMRPLSLAAEWEAVEITPEFTATYGGRPYDLLSASEQYRVRVTLQVALARVDGSDMVVIDAADILDPDGRNGLMGLLDYDDGPLALVAMTMPSRDRAPDLAKAELGATWWLENGVAEPLTQEAGDE